MSKTIKTDASLMQMNSKRSLLELEMIKEDKNNAFESNVIFSENTEANDHSQSQDMEVLQNRKSLPQQKQPFESIVNQGLQTVWLFVLNSVVSEFNEETIKKIYMCPKSYKQAKIMLPLFKFTPECKKFIKKLSQSSPSFKYKIVVDSYNASNSVQQFKNYQNVTEIYIFNDIKEEGLDEILPLKKKTTKIIGVYNSLLSLIMKSEKQMDYQVGFIEKTDKEGKQVIVPVYPNKFPKCSFLPNVLNSQNKSDLREFNYVITSSIGLPIQQKKNQVQKFFSHLKAKFNDNDYLIDCVQRIQDLNHISPIVNHERAQQVLKLYLGLDQQGKPQNFDQNDNGNNVLNVFDHILSSIKDNKSLKNLELGIHQIFHSIMKVSKQPLKEQQENQQFPQNPNISTIDPSKPKQIKVDIQDKVKTQTKSILIPKDYCYKFVVFPIEHLRKMVGSYFQIQQFQEFYSDLKTAQINFNINHTLNQNKKHQRNEQYAQTIYHKVCLKLKLPNQSTKSSNQQSFIVDYGIIQLQQICDTLGIQVPERWKSVCLSNIMSVFKVQKIQTTKINSKFSVQTICLNSTSLKQIFESDPNYLSMNQLKLLNFYKRTNIFKALNGNYRQVIRSKGKKQSKIISNVNKSSNLQILQMTPLKETQKIDVKSNLSNKDPYMRRLLQRGQNSSKVGSVPIQQYNISNLNYYIQTLKDEYIMVGSRHENLKKKIARQKQNATTPGQASYHNQKLMVLIEQLYMFEEQLYEMKLDLQDYHACSYHLQNMETLIIKYPTLDGDFNLKELRILTRKVDIEFRKGHLIEARKGISSILQPLYKLIQTQEAESMSICSGKYLKYILCSCCEKKNLKQELLRKVLEMITNFRADLLADILGFFNNIGQLMLVQHKIKHYFGAAFQQNNDQLTVIGNYLSQKLITSLDKVQNGNNHNVQSISEYNRLIGLFSFEQDTKSTFYLKSIDLLQKTQPFSLKSASFYEQLGDSLKRRLINNKLNINKPQGPMHIFIQDVNKCLELYQRAISILQCHKNTQIALIRNINSIVEILIALDQLQVINQYAMDKLGSILTKQSKSYVCRSEFAYFYYLLSLKNGIQGNFNLSIKMVHKSIEELGGSLLKQNISTYQSILKVSTYYFSFKFQQIKLSILMNKLTQANLQDLKLLKQVYDSHYIVKAYAHYSKSQIYLKFCEIQALYWLQKRSLKHYYRFTYKEILALSNNPNQTQNNQLSYIAFNKLCVLAMKFLTMPKVFIPLLKKIQLMYFQALKDKLISNKSNLKPLNANDSSFSRIQPSFVSSQQIDIRSGEIPLDNAPTKQQSWGVLYWKYYLVRAMHMKTNNQHQESLKCMKKAIQLSKRCHLNNKQIQLRIYEGNKGQVKKSAKSKGKGQQIKKYTIFVYQVQLKYILYVIDCISTKIPLSHQAIEQCQSLIEQIFLIINQMIEVTEVGDIEQLRFDDAIENRMYEIGSHILKYLTSHKLLDERQKKSVQEEIKFYSSPQNLSLTLQDIFDPVYKQVDSRRDQENPNNKRFQQDELLYKQILTNKAYFEQQLEDNLHIINEQLGVDQSQQEYDEMFQKLTPLG